MINEKIVVRIAWQSRFHKHIATILNYSLSKCSISTWNSGHLEQQNAFHTVACRRLYIAWSLMKNTNVKREKKNQNQISLTQNDPMDNDKLLTNILFYDFVFSRNRNIRPIANSLFSNIFHNRVYRAIRATVFFSSRSHRQHWIRAARIKIVIECNALANERSWKGKMKKICEEKRISCHSMKRIPHITSAIAFNRHN